MDNPSRRSVLKMQTAAAHQALDDMIGGFGDLEAYRHYLVGMARFRLPLESWLKQQDPVPAELGDWQPEYYGDDILADLDDLAISPPDAAKPFAPPAGEGLIGLLYVLEGSALGARLLAKRSENIGLSASHGARHIFRQAGNLSSWRTFSDRMERMCVYDDRASSAWANFTFAYARNAFESPF
ncbi:biliverdin-producing heme oxygenase [Rhizobium sp. RU36D]|uniref:biliverdin-producing heme oxygenase n=1 Tax=Rhizobium sp. RU36D TaxID=1907415 RepID=UPI0009D8F3F7|nr:biliverdin-producing heme oxygenase [Rhizobium sp. RU36D]SMC39828.1 heme oxygenase [Rhizobium sp. RU36D]